MRRPKIWKNLPLILIKSADLSKQEGDFFQFLWPFQKSWTLKWIGIQNYFLYCLMIHIFRVSKVFGLEIWSYNLVLKRLNHFHKIWKFKFFNSKWMALICQFKKYKKNHSNTFILWIYIISHHWVWNPTTYLTLDPSN